MPTHNGYSAISAVTTDKVYGRQFSRFKGQANAHQTSLLVGRRRAFGRLFNGSTNGRHHLWQRGVFRRQHRGGDQHRDDKRAGSRIAGDLAVNVGDRVFFGFDKFDLTADARTVLSGKLWMRKNGAVTVLIEGHCDERGTREYNIALGERRASAVRDYLLTLGIDANRIKTISYGKERPVDGGHTETAWKKNRRAVTRVN